MNSNDCLPKIIQGGMGVAVSDWRLARAVAFTGQMGVVSGTALDVVLLRRLQLGDPGGHMQRGLAAFPIPEMADRILEKYYIPGGKKSEARFTNGLVLPPVPTREQVELVVVANFVEVYLAGEGHDELIGINFLEKIQTPTLPSLYGAMLASVDYVLMGAGIPRSIPGVLDQLSRGQAVELPLHVEGALPHEHFVTRFDPQEFTHDQLPWIDRPKFLAIVASASLATMLKRKSNGPIDGFVVEGATAGGHNAPPRGAVQLNERGEPVYGERDQVDYAAMRALGVPFWLAGSYGSHERLEEALAVGAAGIQVGTPFAFCRESGLRDDIKQQVFEMVRNGQADVFTDPQASPTGFPFKVLRIDGSASDLAADEARPRHCDLGFLRHAYRCDDGTIGWRCPAENVAAYVRKAGQECDTVGRKCVCNGLLADVGLGQVRNGEVERPLVTCGNSVAEILSFLPKPDDRSYTAYDVVHRLLSPSGGARPRRDSTPMPEVHA